MNKAALDCRSRAECEELGLKREEAEIAGWDIPSLTGLLPGEVWHDLSGSGHRFVVRDALGRARGRSEKLEVSTSQMDVKAGDESAGVAKVGDDVKIRYRVMRSGKRSYDGLSGEATTLFSLGYGEDDGPKDATLNAPIGQGRFVKALDEALVGMAVGGVRRIQVRPDYGLGWKKEGKCAEAIGAGWTRESRWERSEVLLGELREGVMYEKA
ncbi:Peptidylprolyl isomerase [Durusdinium trenchii]|uniref:peptidylprolyl isomerase n=1 Tax=Durusdinium trenchii TaxID=1381693 RepID=A0ABP0PT87_9DINO